MKTVYQVLYGISAIVFIIVLLGGSLSKPMFNSLSTKTLDKAGIKKSSVDSIDSRIDDIFYNVNKVQLQIEKLKNLFSDKQIDESKYQRVQNEMIARNIYSPINEVLIIAYRIGLFFISVILFLCGLIFHLAFRSMDLRRRLTRLEEIVYERV
jgi:predicted PurR-regulated permease PerM